MKRTLAIVSLITGLVLGGTLMRQNIPVSSAQSATSSTSTKISLNEGNAKLENEKNTVDIVNQYQDGVVYVALYSTPEESPFGSSSDPFFEYFFGTPSTPRNNNNSNQEEQSGIGSGFFIDNQGHILTNYHVVQDAEKIKIRLHRSDKEFEAKVLATAPDYDLALIEAKDIPQNLYVPMVLGDSDKLAVGQKTIAMGAPFDLDFTVTEGIVSALRSNVGTGVRDIKQRAIQTDASINPGNSGGPLLNSSGEVIGINTQIAATARQSAGIGFAIPVNVAKNILPKLKAGQNVSGPRIGVEIFPIDLSEFPSNLKTRYKLPETGLLIHKVTSGSPADKGGLKGGTQKVRLPDGNTGMLGGDVLLKIDNKDIKTLSDLTGHLFNKTYGDTVVIEYMRDGKKDTATLKLEDFKEK